MRFTPVVNLKVTGPKIKLCLMLPKSTLLLENYSLLKKEIGKVIVGQHDAVDHVFFRFYVEGIPY